MNTKTVTKAPLWQRVGDRIVERLENRKPVLVNKKKYCILALLFGWMGLHQFLLGKKFTGTFYLLTCVTGLPVILTAMDLLRAVFMEADAEGNIYL